MKTWLSRSFFAVLATVCAPVLVAPHAAGAQTVPHVSGAAVVTVPAPIPRSPDQPTGVARGDSVGRRIRYEIVPAEGIRLLGA
ncbi:MAG: hypothetical protein V3U67_07325, partial [Gemmatimonadota bacterium]